MQNTLRMISRFSWCLLLIASFGIQACGSEYKDVDVKHYVLAVAGNNQQHKSIFSDLVKRFNEQTGFEALYYTFDEREANSLIQVTAGLDDYDGKIGWGQWSRQTRVESPAKRLRGQMPRREKHYSMQLEFDQEYVVTRYLRHRSRDDLDLLKLFSHEVGHGLEMDHDENPRSVMYFDISGGKDFPEFFKRVREYIQ